MTRRHLPIGSLWSMRIEVPYSLIVRVGGFAWSCGQVPLDADARVLHPGDLAAQMRDVAGHIREILDAVGMRSDDVGKLVLYYVAENGDDAAVLSEARRAFGAKPVLVPVAVPHFYYQGLLVEVDVFAGEAVSAIPSESDPPTAVRVRAVDAGDLVWATVSFDGSEIPLEAVRDSLAKAGLFPDRLLCDHWVIPAGSREQDGILAGLEAAGLLADPGAAVLASRAGGRLLGELTFAPEGATCAKRSSDGVRVISRRSERMCWVSARVEEGGGDLVDQTRKIMKGIEAALAAHGFSFANVVKSTTHYTGGSSEDELHENMRVRNACYRRPGPASTGVPVFGLAGAGSLIAVDLLAVLD